MQNIAPRRLLSVVKLGTMQAARNHESEVGERIAAARRKRGMSRKTVADLVGRSEEWLRQIENGQRRLDSIEYAIRLGEVLRISDLMATLGLTERDGVGELTVASAVVPVREALNRSVSVDVFVEESAGMGASSNVDADVAEAWQSWSGRANRYQRTLRLLPDLLRGAAARLREETGSAGIESAISAYHLTRIVMSRMGEEQLAWISADRAAIAAARVGGAAMQAAAWHLGICNLRQGWFGETYRLATAAIDMKLPDGDDSADMLILSGAMHLVAAEAAAGLLEPQQAQQQLEQARLVAEAVPDHPHPYMIHFGDVEVGITAVQVAFRLGQAGEAIRRASELDVPDHYPPDRQARYYIPLAYLHAQRNEDAAAVFTLAKVAAISPEDIRYDELSRKALRRLLRRHNLTVRRELTRLATLAGLD